MQAQVTLRPTRGLSFQTTYTWSRNLGVGGSYTDHRDRAEDYQLTRSHRSHSFTTYGSYMLPFGARDSCCATRECGDMLSRAGR